ncbi:MAG: HDOD domain-containing protein [Proteobacteria bacterium]|nr:HDOD domain-containing protein [Pseudomonadota bacterium]
MKNNKNLILPLLVVTRDPDINEKTKNLQATGYQVRYADGDAMALSMLGKYSFPLIIMDQNALGNDLGGIISLIKKKNVIEKNQMILITDAGDDEKVLKGYDFQVDEVVSRPVEEKELVFRLNRAKRVFLLEKALKQTVRRMQKMKEDEPEKRGQISKNMETLGRLAAGVIHEINTPVQYVGDNLHFLGDSVGSLFDALDHCADILVAHPGIPIPQHVIGEIMDTRKRLDINYLKDELPESIRQSLQGVERISEIVLAIRNLSNQSQENKKSTDILKAISTCVTVTRNEWKKVAELKTDFASVLPEVQCSPGAFTQVVVNLIINAAHAIEEVHLSDPERRGLILITARHMDQMLEVRISDNGAGIPETIGPQIFDPFFSTKQEGKGTGQGLSISKSIIEDYKGQLTVETQPGRGSAFVITLPVKVQDTTVMLLPQSIRGHGDEGTQDVSLSARHILFVDDEKEILNGISRMLKPMEGIWNMSFTQSGRDALEFLKKNQVDVVVSDFTMKEMNGLIFLDHVKNNHPQIIRIMLSGEIDWNFIMKTVHIVHQFIAKPTDAEMLKVTISRAFDMKRLLINDDLRRAVANMDSLPSLPSIYTEITKELRSPNGSMKKVSQLIAHDTAMTTKILQLVNSAFFSLPTHISNPEQAVALLGFETVKALVLHYEIFSKVKIDKKFRSFLEQLSRHNMATGHLARKIAICEKKDKATVDQAFMGGILHDCGKLILASNFPDDFSRVLALSDKKNQQSYVSVEKEVFKTSHSDVGAYLTGIWGFPLPIVNAIFYHHLPSLNEEEGLGPATAVYVANAMVEGSGDNLDMAFLSKRGLGNKLATWLPLMVEQEAVD